VLLVSGRKIVVCPGWFKAHLHRRQQRAEHHPPEAAIAALLKKTWVLQEALVT